jgi:lipopolysaccharide heptosyltransferase II
MNDGTGSAWSGVRNILCVRLDYLGDVLMTTPALRALRESFPGSRITLLTSRGGAAVCPYLPEIDDTLVYDAPWLKNGAPHSPDQDRAMMALLAERQFDAAVIFTVYSQNPLPSALLCHLAGIPLRLAHCRENPYRLLSHWVPETEPERQLRHEVRRQLDLVAHVGATTVDERLSFRIPPEDRLSLEGKLQGNGLTRLTLPIVLHPGATAASRRYPPEYFAQAARELHERTGCTFLVTGDNSERELTARMSQQIPGAIDLAGVLTLGELAALIDLCALVICNNTGPAHLAAAIGTPVVDLYALTNPQHTPWQVPSRVLFHDVDCRFCYKSVCPQGHHDCLRQVRPGAVAGAALELLHDVPASLPRNTPLAGL